MNTYIKNSIMAAMIATAVMIPINIKDSKIIKSPRIEKTEDIRKQFSDYVDKKLYYTNPFEDLRGREIRPDYKHVKDTASIDSLTIERISIYTKAQEFSDTIAKEAIGIYNHEHKALNEHPELMILLTEWIMEQDSTELRKNNEIRVKKNIPLDRSVYRPEKKKFHPGMEEYEAEKDSLLSKLEYYGSNLPEAKNSSLKLASLEEMQKAGLKGIDCISYILECMTRATGRNYFQSYLAQDATGISSYLISQGFETIFIAQNTTSKDEKYGYNKTADKSPSYVKDYMRNIRRKNYYVNIDYLVTGNHVISSAFRKFLKQTDGVVLMQEGFHSGIESEGKLLDAHYNTSPLYSPVFTQTDFIGQLDNDDPKHDYQGAVLFVPKGSVEAFITNNFRRFEKEPSTLEKEALKDSLTREYFKGKTELYYKIVSKKRK